MRSVLRVPSLLIWLAALWVALWGEVTLGNIAGGFAVAVGVVAVARPTGVTGLERTYFRPIAALTYVGYFFMQLLKSNLIVAWDIVTPGPKLQRAIIAVRMHTLSAGLVTLVANSVTLTPGTVTVDVHEERDADAVTSRTLFIHVLHYKTVESVRRDVLLLERLAVKAFGAREDLGVCDAALDELNGVGS